MKRKSISVVLSAGVGKRMGSNVAKQYMLLKDKPVICYGLQAFENSTYIDECILVVGKGEVSHIKKEIVEKYGFEKVTDVIEGGAERYLSVQNAMAIVEKKMQAEPDTEFIIFVHDGARPLVTETIIQDTYEAACTYGACCTAMPVTDTIKVASPNGFAIDTPDRSTLYAVQTPQVFKGEIIVKAYKLLEEQMDELLVRGIRITDDAMVVEQMLAMPVKLVEGSYENIKLTTPEDLEVAIRFLDKRNGE